MKNIAIALGSVVTVLSLLAFRAEAAKTCVSTDGGEFRLDTRSVHTMVGAPITVTYSGDMWGADGAGETVDLVSKRGSAEERTVASGLADDGTYDWYPERSGVYILTLRSGTAVLTAVFDVSHVAGMLLLLK